MGGLQYRFVHWCFAACLACTVLHAANVRADETARATALNLFDQGRAAFDHKQYEQAITHFKASLQLLPSPNTRLYLARCYRGLGRTASAYTNFKLAAREAADRLAASGEQRYKATQETAEAEAAELESKVPHLKLSLPANPGGLIVKLDDGELSPSAWNTTLEVDPGAHKITALAPRYREFSQEFSIAEGEQKQLDVQLVRLPTATMTLEFKMKPAGTSVQIDGKPLDPARMEETQQLDPGQHNVIVRAPGYKDFHWNQDLADGSAAKVPVVLQVVPGGGGGGGTPKWLFYGVAATSLIALGAASYFAVDATSRANTEKDKDPLQRSISERDSIGDEATTANVLFIGGAALAAGAVVLAFTTDWGPKTERATLTPVMVPGMAGAVARGSF